MLVRRKSETSILAFSPSAAQRMMRNNQFQERDCILVYLRPFLELGSSRAGPLLNQNY